MTRTPTGAAEHRTPHHPPRQVGGTRLDCEDVAMTAVPVALSPLHLGLVRDILARNGVTDVNAPVLFGSRVTGRARRYSDLDIGFDGEPLSARQLAQLREDLEESSLPIRVDVLNFAEAGAELREHALAKAVPLELAVGAAG